MVTDGRAGNGEGGDVLRGVPVQHGQSGQEDRHDDAGDGGQGGVNPGDLGRLANQLTRDYDVLASNSANAAATSNSQDVSGVTSLLQCLVIPSLLVYLLF